ncbi:unnamed protein product [Peniophora sp. CBMAI 1063]|nr:unnamed protein product [Peniophora sp. CBMAI 1063]
MAYLHAASEGLSANASTNTVHLCGMIYIMPSSLSALLFLALALLYPGTVQRRRTFGALGPEPASPRVPEIRHGEEALSTRERAYASIRAYKSCPGSSDAYDLRLQHHRFLKRCSKCINRPHTALAIACRYPRSKSPPNSTIPTPIVNVHYVLPIVLSFPNELLPAAPTTAVVPEIREEWGH